MTDEGGETMTIAPHTDPLQSEQPHQKADPRDHAHKVAAIVGLAETGLREAESERVTRDRLEDGIEVLRTLLTLPWSERTLEVDRVLHTEKGDLDEDRIVEYLNRLKRGESSLQARHGMVRGDAQSVIGEGWEVAQHLYAVADGFLASPPQAPSPVHRDALPPAVPAGPAPVPEPLPKRVAQPTPAEPMYPPAPPESPAEQTGVIAQKAVESLRRAGHDTPASDAALASLNGASATAFFGPAADSSFGATSLPQVRAGDTQRMAPVPAHAPEVLADLAQDDAPAELAPRGKGLAPGGVRTGASAAGASDRQFLELTDTVE